MLRLTNGTRAVAAPWRGRAIASAFGWACLAAASSAQAHIILVSDGGPDTPKDWLVMTNTIGDPQKPTPCGGTGTPTNVVTTFHAGQSVTVTWIEAIAHSGHFRIAFAPVSPAAATATALPDPVVTAYTDNTDTAATTVAVTPTGGSISSTGIVLADNLFPHCTGGDPCPAGVPHTTAPKTYSATVTLPTTPCANCTLQIVQFMSYHGPDPSFFYHHCAAINIAVTDAGSIGNPGDDASAEGGGTDSGSDTGNAGFDSGMTATDSGSLVSDSGHTGPSVDAGDSSLPGMGNDASGSGGTDAGQGSDAAPTDAASGGGGSSPSSSSPSGSSSSGCSMVEARGGSSSAAVGIGVLGVAAALARRRRRRDGYRSTPEAKPELGHRSAPSL